MTRNFIITESSLVADYDIIKDFPSNEDKKSIAAKYNIKSNKGAEIAEYILGMIGDIRSNKTEFTKDDITMWKAMKKSSDLCRLCGIKKAFEGESVSFINYIRDYYDNFDTTSLKNRFKVKIVEDIRKSIHRYFNEVVNRSNDTFLKSLITRIENELSDYHSVYIENNKKFFNNMYDNCRKVIETYLIDLDNIKKQLGEYYFLHCEYDEFVHKRRAAFDKAQNKIGGKPKEQFIEFEIEQVERIWKNDICAIAERVRRKDMKEDAITITNPHSDPKFVEIHINDGERHLWARSIIAAMSSIKVRPHYRFIITEE